MLRHLLRIIVAVLKMSLFMNLVPSGRMANKWIAMPVAAGADTLIATHALHSMSFGRSGGYYNKLVASPFLTRQHHNNQYWHSHSSAVVAAAFASQSSSSYSTTFFSARRHHIINRVIAQPIHNRRHSTKFSTLVVTTNANAPSASTIGDGEHQQTPQISKRLKASNRIEGRRKVADINRERNARMHSLFLQETSQSNRKMSTASTTATTDSSDNESVTNHSIIDDSVPLMFAVKVVTCPTLQSELNMNGREKRGRMFVERPFGFLSTVTTSSISNTLSTTSIDSSLSSTTAPTTSTEINEEGYTMEEESGLEMAKDHACTSLPALRRTIHEFFRRLQKGTYVLSASLPEFDEEGNILVHNDEDSDDDNDDGTTNSSSGYVGTWPLESDEDVRMAFSFAEEYFFQQHRTTNNNVAAIKRPTLILHVTKDTNAPPPPPPPAYLTSMPDPNTSPTMTMLSFYAFPPGGISDPDSTAELLKRTWKPFTALGRVYVANEGVNAQMSIPTNVVPAFLKCCCATNSSESELYSILGPYVENGINVDPDPVERVDFEKNPPFTGLHIRVREQIVADGFDTPLNWQSAGYDMPPLEWHQKLKEAREKKSTSTSSAVSGEGSSEDESLVPIVLDCRNDYESQVGNFLLAEPLNTKNFRESWDVLKERLKDVPKDAPIMTYCTVRLSCFFCFVFAGFE